MTPTGNETATFRLVAQCFTQLRQSSQHRQRMYNNIVARSRTHCCSGKAVIYSVCIVELPVTINYIKIFSVAQQCFYGG